MQSIHLLFNYFFDSLFDAWNIPMLCGSFLAFVSNYDEVLILSLVTIIASFGNHAVKIYSKIMDERRKQKQFDQELKQDHEEHLLNMEKKKKQ